MGALAWTLCALQATAPAPTAPAPAAPSGPTRAAPIPAPEEARAPIEPWDGTLADGLDAVRAQAEAGDLPAAIELSNRLLAPTEFARFRLDLAERTDGWSEGFFEPLDPLLDGLGLSGWADPVRGEVHFARGLVYALEPNPESAIAELERALALAGDGTLRLDAAYDSGTIVLGVAEGLFAEASAGAGAPMPIPGAAGAPGGHGAPGGGEDAPDPLDLAEAAFREARAKLVRRLRLDWRDEDTRANLEWIQRRLAEIDELRRQREEQEQQQEQQQQPDDSSSEDQEQDPQDSEDQEEQEQDPEDEPQDSETRDSDREQEPQESEPEDSRAPEDEPTEADAPEPEPQEGQPGEEPPAPEEAAEPAERLLTREEVLRLLDLLEQIEEEGERVRAQLRSSRRQKVEKDW